VNPKPVTPPPADSLTPAMRQYWEQKQQAGDAILLFRMGDFYEMFYDDAELGARVLGITLTSRDSGKTPLAGIPYHALDGYLSKLVAAGHRVAISEQVEDAKASKGVVKRAIVRIVTPGTLTDDALLDRSEANPLAALAESRGAVGLAWIELSTGVLRVQVLGGEEAAADALERLAPAELLLAEGREPGRSPWEKRLRPVLSTAFAYRPSADFSTHRAEQLLCEQFEVQGLNGFGFDTIDVSLQAAGALIAYVRETQVGAAKHLQPPRRVDASRFMSLDPATLRSLEVVSTMRGSGKSGTVQAAVDRTATPMGARLLREWLCYPLRDRESIQQRLRFVAVLREQAAIRSSLRASLGEIGDIERVVGRIGVGRTHPRDLRGLGDGLRQLPTIREQLLALHQPAADTYAEQLSGLDELADKLCLTLSQEAPTTLHDGGIIADGVSEELDRLRRAGLDSATWLAEFQAREAQRLGVPKLKVGFNKVFGYYIEISHAHRPNVPDDYVRKQTVKNAERYISDELKQYETEVLSAESRAKELEYALFDALREHVEQHIAALQRVAGGLAEIDVLVGWSVLAGERDYCQPEFVAEPVLQIDAGRHPVVEQSHDAFVPNDADLSATQKSLGIITGPNMAGKSTYIRQVALLTLLAHCGSFVPAKRMRLGVVDRIFTRVGASDELSRGQSTFMVEMLETANILHNATAQSLVVLDEVGRGTSTFDGLALAWAIAEHLAERTRCRSLFATHYHELTELETLLDGAFNLNVLVKEYEEELVFLHRIAAGAADRSYGLHVAKLAGVPPAMLERAHAVLNELEQTFSRESQRPALAAVQRRRQRQLRLFEEPEEAIVREVREAKPAELDPQAAAELIRKWQSWLGGEFPAT
jgi:DNA mismatch repair protein MutS